MKVPLMPKLIKTLTQFWQAISIVTEDGEGLSNQNPLPVQPAGIVSSDNSSAIPLGADGVFMGDAIEITTKGIIFINIFSDVASAVDGLKIQQSSNGINWDHDDVYTIPAGKGKNYAINPFAKFAKVDYVNGSTPQGVFRLQTIIKANSLDSSHRIQDSIVDEDDARLVKSVLSGQDQNGIFRNVKTSEVGNLRVADFLVEVGRRNIPGYAFLRKFGQIDAIQAAIPADIWEFGITVGAEKYTFSADGVADIDTVSSDNAGDTQEIIVEGLDINGDEVIQTVTLNGQNKVTLTTALWRFNRAYNNNTVDFLGDIYIYVDGVITAGVPNVVTTVRGFILAGKGQTNQSIYTVPNGKKSYLFGEEINLTKASGATVVAADCQSKSRIFGKVFRNKEFFTLISSGNSSKLYNFPVPLEDIGKTDFLPSADVSANGVGISWAYTMLIIDD